MATTNLALSTITVIFLVAFALYLYLKHRYRYWADRRVPFLKPHPLFGNMQPTVMRGVSEIEHNHDLYRRLAGYKFAGYFRFQRPALLIRDPDLIKNILAKDFSYFQARNENLQRDNEPLSYNLFALNGSRWKRLRVKLTPTFTSGKIKTMFHLVKECADLLSDMIDERLGRSIGGLGGEEIEIEVKELLVQYSTDVISSCAYGIQADSLRNQNAEFKHVSKRILGVTFRRKLFRLLNSFSPSVVRFFGLVFWEKYLTNFFLKLISDTVDYREQNHVERKDFVNILMDLRKKELSAPVAEEDADDDKLEMTLELMAAQCFIFFLAGFETSSGIISVCLLELAKHQTIQNKLREEIDEAIERNNGQLTYDVLQSMPYMEKVVCETMRLYPSLSVLLRQCTKTYEIPDTDVVIEKGTEVFIPVYGLHHDPQYYPNPEQFNPENFSEENKNSRHPFTYLPFGEGPRICIGARFGMMQVKLGLSTLLHRHNFTLSSKMKLPVKFVPTAITAVIQGGIWLNCSKCR